MILLDLLFGHFLIEPIIKRLEARWPHVNVRWWLAVGTYLFLMVLVPFAFVSIRAMLDEPPS